MIRPIEPGERVTLTTANGKRMRLRDERRLVDKAAEQSSQRTVLVVRQQTELAKAYTTVNKAILEENRSLRRENQELREQISAICLQRKGASILKILQPDL